MRSITVSLKCFSTAPLQTRRMESPTLFPPTYLIFFLPGVVSLNNTPTTQFCLSPSPFCNRSSKPVRHMLSRLFFFFCFNLGLKNDLIQVQPTVWLFFLRVVVFVFFYVCIFFFECFCFYFSPNHLTFIVWPTFPLWFFPPPQNPLLRFATAFLVLIF